MTKVTISRWGNSSAIRLPKAVMDELGLADGQTVDLTVKDGRAIIEKKRLQLAPPLEEMVAEMNRLGWENEPETVDWGPDVGSERFYDHD
ncbi:AbrB/MazE/SpoVT family DNA-binding domain-containing protein [Rhizobium sp. 32-5/1]|uniref:AbrB/MazE/SpoVT family DNA-binding domain-containing protein n=1 Tax=Rhizobium sp. 32-5/1 TaxID=3019602 RepID=UPI00240CE689|nr:AbrB/MazE/SpoVT family DNA-binding domain-containing protein [Rhizobium sp. 32-5/1]WEZ83125.1 AbrB/MazE/SpoVT family DNA-binding domain-containing protein [Rhizobium sp. 32-5/1]